MATNYYYKFREDEVDPSKEVPVAIDELFLPKPPGDITAEEKVGLLDINRDLSEIFAFSSDTKPSTSMLGGEKTNILTSVGSDISILPNIKTVSDSRIEIFHRREESPSLRKPSVRLTVPPDPNGFIPANQTVTIPSQYQDRYMLFSCVIRFGPGYHISSHITKSIIIRAGLVPPGTSTLNVKNGYIKSEMWCDINMWVYLHEVEIEDPSELRDLSDIYASSQNFKIKTWWGAAMVLTTGTVQAGSGTMTYGPLPVGGFDYVAIGSTRGDSRNPSRDWGSGYKPPSTTSLKINVEGPVSLVIVGIPDTGG